VIGVPLRFGCVLAGDGNFSVYCHIQTDSGSHPASYPMGARDSSSGVKVAGLWSWPLTSIQCRMCGAIPPLPNTPSWHVVHLKYRDNITFTLLYFTTCTQAGCITAMPGNWPARLNIKTPSLPYLNTAAYEQWISMKVSDIFLLFMKFLQKVDWNEWAMWKLYLNAKYITNRAFYLLPSGFLHYPYHTVIALICCLVYLKMLYQLHRL
jgi:hypothetical protein